MYNQLQRQLAFQHKSSTSCSLLGRRYSIRHATFLKTCCVTTLTAAKETNIHNATIKLRNKIFGFLLRQSLALKLNNVFTKICNNQAFKTLERSSSNQY